jgi:hypothetical protein
VSTFHDAHPLRASCRSCDGGFEVAELAARRDGCCPRCEEPLSPRWTTLLVEEAENLQTVHDALIRCLRRLAGLPGNLRLDPEPVLANLRELVPWDDQLRFQPGRVRDQVAQARARIEDLAHHVADGVPASEVDRAVHELRQLAERVRTVALLLDIDEDLTGSTSGSAGDAARASAEALDRVAGRVATGERDPAVLGDVVDRAERVAELAERAERAPGVEPA